VPVFWVVLAVVVLVIFAMFLARTGEGDVPDEYR
jgi:hypothetical protein